MITEELKERIVTALLKRSEDFPSDKKFAVAYDINSAVWSRIRKGERDRVLSDAKWINLARQMEVRLFEGYQWKTARTPAFNFIYQQLEDCQRHSISGMLVDIPDLGKTHTAKVYASNNSNVVYVDCSQVKSKQLFVRTIAKSFGLDHTGRYADVYQDLVWYLQSVDSPLVILDEAGDLKMEAFLEIKALWNATEHACGWFMMGADGLQAKMERQRALKKVGFAEIFRRFGSRFQKVSPDGGAALTEFKQQQFALVAKANGLGDFQKLYKKSNGSLERCRIEYEKRQRSKDQQAQLN